MVISEEALAKRFNNISQESFGIDIANKDIESHEKIAWKCKDKHIWVDKIINRTKYNKNCPKCDSK